MDLKISKGKYPSLFFILYNYFDRVQGSSPNQKGKYLAYSCFIPYIYCDRGLNLKPVELKNIKTEIENQN